MATVAIAACLFTLGHTSMAMALAPRPDAPAPPPHSSADRTSDREDGDYESMVAVSTETDRRTRSQKDAGDTPPGQDKNTPSGVEKDSPPAEKDTGSGEEKDTPPGQDRNTPWGQAEDAAGAQPAPTSTVGPTRGSETDADSGGMTKSSGSSSKTKSGESIATVKPDPTTATTTTSTTNAPAETTPVASGAAVVVSPPPSTTSTLADGRTTERPVLDEEAVSPLPGPGDWSFLTGEAAATTGGVSAVEEPVAIGGAADTTSVVFSWLMERETGSSSMAVLTPLIVVWTIWDAVTSAGSGLAAPASGLATFVVLVLFDKSRLPAPSGLLRRSEAAA